MPVFMLDLWYNQHSVLVEIMDLKQGLLSKDLFSSTQQHGGCKDSLIKNKSSV